MNLLAENENGHGRPCTPRLRILSRLHEVIEDQPGPWRDTAVIPAGGQVKLGFVADNPGKWGIQSTIAERIDSGLITSFEVSP